MMYWLQQLQMKRWEFCDNLPKSFVKEDAGFPLSVDEAQPNDCK